MSVKVQPVPDTGTGTSTTRPESQIVDFDGADDPYNPRNWAVQKKICAVALYALTTFGSGFSSSIFSTGARQISRDFGVGEDVASLGTSFILLGFGTGPMLWSPLSEMYGRKLPVVAPYFIACCFTFGTAAAHDIQTILLTRFFAGFFASAPIAITGGVLTDLFTPQLRGLAVTGFAVAVVGGPVLGPIIGAAIMQSQLGWRWTQCVTGIYMAVICVLDSVFVSESYAPALLVAKARRLRFSTGDWALHAKHEEWNPTWREMMHKFLLRPLQLLTTPICFLIALHSSFVYSIVYLSLGSFPIIFQDLRGLDQLAGSLPFLVLFIGVGFGAGLNVYNQRFYLGRNAVPEARLPPMMIGGVAMALGLFITANTADPSIHLAVPIVGAGFMGLGFFVIILAATSYVVDIFPTSAASAVAAHTFMRSGLAAMFPPLVGRMYAQLGTKWATNMLGFIALAMIPIPWFFYFRGPKIRAKDSC